MNTELITEIKKNAFIVILDEADTTKQEIEKLFDYAESKSYRIFSSRHQNRESICFVQPHIKAC